MKSLLRNLASSSVKVSDGVALAVGVIAGVMGGLVTLWLLPGHSGTDIGVFVAAPVSVGFLVFKAAILYDEHIAAKKAGDVKLNHEGCTTSASHGPGKLTESSLTVWSIVGAFAAAMTFVFAFSAVVYWLVGMPWAVLLAGHIALGSLGLLAISVISVAAITIRSIVWEYRASLAKELSIHFKFADPRERLSSPTAVVKVRGHS